jgi:hypothetical protein
VKVSVRVKEKVSVRVRAEFSVRVMVRVRAILRFRVRVRVRVRSGRLVTREDTLGKLGIGLSVVRRQRKMQSSMRASSSLPDVAMASRVSGCHAKFRMARATKRKCCHSGTVGSASPEYKLVQ